MRTESSPDIISCLRKDVDQSTTSDNFFFQAIENADGIPYQLIFGSEPGEGYFRNIGSGVKNLFGVIPAVFTENYLLHAINNFIPLYDSIPANPVEARKIILNGKIKRYKAEFSITMPDGEVRWIRDAAVPLLDEKEGKVIGLTGIFFNISEQKQILIKLEKASIRATESDRLKTAFLNNLSHEIRTPLNAIVGFTTLLGEPGNVHPNRMEFMDIITHSSDHLLEIVDDIVEISKIETKIVRLIRKKTNLNEMLLRVFNRFKPAADEKKIILRYNVRKNDEPIILVTDGYKLFQSMINLVGNAVKFTNEGEVDFGLYLKDDKIHFYVTDTGIGISKEHQPFIFNPFYQAETSCTKRYEGTGLGLSIARAYIQLLGGEIRFVSVPAKGSVFCFHIPDTRNVII